MDNYLGIIIQILTILSFVGVSIKFFMTLGEYKAIINTKLDDMEKDIDELKKENKNLQQEIGNLKSNTDGAIHRVEALLIKVETKMEILMSYSGIGKDGKSKN